jgi:hypothetical protein
MSSPKQKTSSDVVTTTTNTTTVQLQAGGDLGLTGQAAVDLAQVIEDASTVRMAITAQTAAEALNGILNTANQAIAAGQAVNAAGAANVANLASRAAPNVEDQAAALGSALKSATVPLAVAIVGGAVVMFALNRRK